MYSLDSDVVIDSFNNDVKIIGRIKETELQGVRFFVTPIVLAELYEGAYKSKDKKKNLELIEEFLLAVEIIDFSINASRIFGRCKDILKTAGKPTQDFDLLIASITLDQGLTLVTRNKKHFENIPDLKIEVW